MNAEPRIPKRIFWGGFLLLFAFALPWTVLALAFWVGLLVGHDMSGAGVWIGTDGPYRVGASWWLATPLAMASVVASVRAIAGRVDWFAPAVAAAWLAVGLVIGSGTMQLSFAALSAIALYLLASGVLRYRRTLPSRS
jgi:hypothetical protein